MSRPPYKLVQDLVYSQTISSCTRHACSKRSETGSYSKGSWTNTGILQCHSRHQRHQALLHVVHWCYHGWVPARQAQEGHMCQWSPSNLITLRTTTTCQSSSLQPCQSNSQCRLSLSLDQCRSNNQKHQAAHPHLKTRAHDSTLAPRMYFTVTRVPFLRMVSLVQTLTGILVRRGR